MARGISVGDASGVTLGQLRELVSSTITYSDDIPIKTVVTEQGVTVKVTVNSRD